MSHVITTNTEITKAEPAKAALEENGWDYQELDSRIQVRSGPLGGATIDLATGKIHGDTDYHDNKKLNALNAPYAKHMVMQDIQGRGGVIESNEVMSDGNLRIVAQVTVV